MPRVRSKHNDLMNYFIHDKRDLSPAYVASCRKFLNNPKLKFSKIRSRRLQAPSFKLQAPSAIKQTQKKDKIKI
jgi:hypothetical protein|tara:strand:+ start:54 stop:275 length:222 start_codon:yes stop_codon:yes gene_type:complete